MPIFISAAARRALRAGLPLAALLAFCAIRPAHAASVFETDLPAPAGAVLTALPNSAHLSVVLVLPMRDPAGAQAFIAQVSNPASPDYGHYLTPAEFGARFGASQAAYDFVRNWAIANGFTVGARTDAHTMVRISGTAGHFAHIFATRFATFQTNGHGLGRAMLTTPRLPAALHGYIQSVVGLASRAQFAPLYRVLPRGLRADVGTGIGGGYAPSDLRTAYDVPAQTSATPTETVAVFEQGGYLPSDITTFNTQYGLNVPVSSIGVNGSSTAPSGNSVEAEAALDIDAIEGMNPDVKQILVYVDTASSFSTALVDGLTQIAQDDTAKVVSISYGLDEKSQGQAAVSAENTVLMQLASQGQTVFVSAGDGGASGSQILGIIPLRSGQNVEDPGSQPYVTSVGGTTLNVTSNEDWSSEVTWNKFSAGEGATGGGVSAYWAIPSYQLKKGVSVATANGGSATNRNVPDVAADADPTTGYSIYSDYEGGWVPIGGTSLSSPLWAGFTSVINADRVAKKLPRVGYINTLLYAKSPLAAFHDITSGNNSVKKVTGYTAGTGYDDVTGWGSLDLGKLLPLVTR